MADTRNPKTAYEPSDWPIAPIGLLFAGILILLVVSPLVLMWAYPTTLSDVSRKLTVEPPAPRLEIDPAKELAAFRSRETAQLNTYYWINRQDGIVHIPIEQAMKNLVKQGIPGFPQAASQ